MLYLLSSFSPDTLWLNYFILGYSTSTCCKVSSSYNKANLIKKHISYISLFCFYLATFPLYLTAYHQWVPSHSHLVALFFSIVSSHTVLEWFFSLSCFSPYLSSSVLHNFNQANRLWCGCLSCLKIWAIIHRCLLQVFEPAVGMP